MSESEFEQNLYQQRREKLAQIIALGQPAYPNSYAATHTIPELRAAFDHLTTEQLDAPDAARIEASIAGRIMAIRVQGKAGFAQLQQGGQRFQIYVRKDDVGEDSFAVYKLLDLGDHIGVRGYLFRTRTGELTVHVTTFTFLTKAMLALPDKFHGLEDTELRYRQRYLDLFINTDVREVFVKRAAVLRALRTFFDARRYLEVETPMMHTIAGGAAARPFKTRHNALDLELSLRIAPELYLKRLVVGGLDRVYEINRNFRNEGTSTQHNPEFTMLEFYQAYANYHDLMDLTKELVTFVATEVNGTTICNFNGHQIDLGEWTEFTMVGAIRHYWPGELGARPTQSDFCSQESLRAMLLRASEAGESFFRNGRHPPSRLMTIHNALGFALIQLHSEPVGKVTTFVFESVAERELIQPTIIYDFPLAVSPLSKQKPDDPDWVERFEFYIGGFEVGNAFSELNDPVDQRARFEAQLTERERGDDEAHQMDEDYVRALGYGLPPTAGEGIGIDRLVMILTGSKSIRDVILFPLLRPQANKQRPAPDPAHGESAE